MRHREPPLLPPVSLLDTLPYVSRFDIPDSYEAQIGARTGYVALLAVSVNYPFHCWSTLVGPPFRLFLTFLLLLLKVAFLHVYTSQN